jgi:hypothetical protein
MKEDFLHYVWKYKLFHKDHLKSTLNEEIHVLKSGTHNFNTGPDFLNAKIEINAQIWAGNVEIHIKSSDWYLHNHEQDENYDATILHVVYEHDAVVFRKDNSTITTLVLKDLIDQDLCNQYNKLFAADKNWIPCENEIHTVGSFTFTNWQERLFIERLERKSLYINELLIAENNDFEAVLFQLLAKNFGLKVNAAAFLSLSKSIDFSVLRKTSFDENQLAALLFGQAGFLEENTEEVYHRSLKTEYDYLKHKYQLQPLSKKQFSFFRMRPNNFPTLRIAQLVSLLHLQQNLFSKLITIAKVEDFYDLFSIEIHTFWKTHYTFETTSKKSPKKLTRSFIDLLIINTIIPLKFVYKKRRGDLNEDTFIEILKQVKPEKNAIISKFNDLKINLKNLKI